MPAERRAPAPVHALILGGSRGIGLAAAAHLAPRVARLWCASRTPAPHGQWVPADVATDAGLDAIRDAVGAAPLDALLFLGGSWEAGAFTAAYDFALSPRAETRDILAVNLAAPILLAQALAPALQRSAAPRFVAIGALGAGRPGFGPEVANSAAKAGLRGAADALAASFPWLAVTLIHPGNVATPEVEADIAAGRFPPQRPIPMADLLAALDFALAVSQACRLRELDLAQAG